MKLTNKDLFYDEDNDFFEDDEFENDEELVNDIYEDEDELAEEGRKLINPIPVAALAGTIIILCTALAGYNVKNTSIKNRLDKQREQEELEVAEQIAELEANPDYNLIIVEKDEEYVGKNDNTPLMINYAGVSEFYQHIINNRNQFGEFAEAFQSEEDIKNFINFTYLFDEIYSNANISSSISKKEDFDYIVSSYYASCAKNKIKPEMNIILNANENNKALLKEAEDLAFNLHNGVGNDYTEALAYYTWYAKNLSDGRTNIPRIKKNAPLIEVLRWQFQEYRYVGNMLEARTYCKNDSLPIGNLDVYYAESYPEGTIVEETQNAFTCPDWGVDNVVSPTEENEETSLVYKFDGDNTFEEVDEAFRTILGSGRTLN